MRRLTVGQAIALAATVLAIVAAAGLVAGAGALSNLADARTQLVDDVDPALDLFGQGYRVVADQELGARSYVLTADPSLLRRYRLASAEGEVLARRLSALLRRPSLKPVLDEAIVVGAQAQRWQRTYLQPALAMTKPGRPDPRAVRIVKEGRPKFEALRTALDRQIAAIRELRVASRAELDEQADRLNLVFLLFAVMLVVAGASVVALVGLGVVRPIGRLARQSRAVAGGAFATPIEAGGPRDVRGLGRDVEAMRERILSELRELEAREQDLQRSNAELEQFAYVASHDLQEPLRKVASFTQLLQRRYGGQLDDKADQYIEFAVDGAKRMQVLINDLLAFSRVGRIREDLVEVRLDDALDLALKALGTAIDESGAQVTRPAALPVVRGELSLLALVFQNLVGNAIKFRREDEAPRVHVDVTRDGDRYELCVRDEGIGIDPSYAERIFVIFQRLHPKEEYAGTGIGLAMCRKVVEYHGGRIWLDTSAGKGTTFRFTLPVPPPTSTEPKTP